MDFPRTKVFTFYQFINFSLCGIMLVVSNLRILCPDLDFRDFFLCFPRKVLYLKFKHMIHFELIFVESEVLRPSFIPFSLCISTVSAPFTDKSDLPPLNCFCILVKQLSVFVWVFLGSLFSSSDVCVYTSASITQF